MSFSDLNVLEQWASIYDLAILSSINVAINEGIGEDPTLIECDESQEVNRLTDCIRYTNHKLVRALSQHISRDTIWICHCFIPIGDRTKPRNEDHHNHSFLLITTDNGYRVASNHSPKILFLRHLAAEGWTNFERITGPGQTERFCMCAVYRDKDVTILPELKGLSHG